MRKLFGKWNEALYCGVAPSAKCIWRPGIYKLPIKIFNFIKLLFFFLKVQCLKIMNCIMDLLDLLWN